MTPEFDVFDYWLQIEVVVFATGLLANITFLFVRSFVCQKITLTIGQLMLNENTDYLESQQILGGIYITFFVPAGVLLYIKYLCAT